MGRYPERHHPEGSDTPFGFGPTDWLDPFVDPDPDPDWPQSRIEARLDRDISDRLADDQIDLIYGPGPFPYAGQPDGIDALRYMVSSRPTNQPNLATTRYRRDVHGQADTTDFPDADAPAEQILGALNELVGDDWLVRMTGGRRCDGERTLFIELTTKSDGRPER